MSKLKLEWNLKFLFKCLSIKAIGIIFHWWKLLSNNLRIHEHCKLTILEIISTLFKPPLSYSLRIVSCLIFVFFPLHKNYFWMFFNRSIKLAGTFVTNARWIILENARVLKILILPSNVRFLVPHIFKMEWILII